MNHCLRILISTLVFTTLFFFSGLMEGLWAQGEVMIFSAIGDVPYSQSELNTLQQHIDNHNLYSPSLFLMHVGDIKSGSESCQESRYRDVSNILKTSEVPVFIIPGDNEWGDCSSPSQGWSWWSQYFMRFDENFCLPVQPGGALTVERQSGRPENIALVLKGVLVVAVNIPNQTESGYQARLQDDADWVTQQFQQKASQVRAAVVFGHAGPNSSRNTYFFNPFRQAASAFGKPVLYLMGDGHKWVQDNPWPEPNMMRVQVERGSKPPVEVTVSLDPQNMFSFNRTPWGPGSQPINRPPCGQDGPVITVNPESHNYGSLAVGASTSKTFVVTNPGNETLSVTATSLVGTHPNQFNVESGGGAFTLAPAATRNVVVSFNPTSEGSKSATLRFDNNDPNHDPFNVTLSGTGVIPQPDITVNPTTHNFGVVTIGGSESKIFVVSNSGSIDLNVTATALVGSNAGEFSIDSGGGAFTLAPGANRNVQVSFNPESEGSKSAALRFESDDPDENPFDVELNGSGVLPGSGPFVFHPTDDAYVNSSNPTSNFGASSTLRVRNSSTILNSYLKFVVSGINGSAQSATLRLYVTQSSDGGSVFSVSNNYAGTSTAWTESGLNYNNAPALSGSALSTLGSVTSGQWVEFDVTAAITGNGTFSFGIKNSSSTAVFYSSKEGANEPELVVTGGGIPPPAPDIASFSPASGPVGTEVTISGSDFSGATAVQFNGVSASGYVVDSSSQIRAVVPSGATDGPISVTTPGGTAASAADFDVTAPPAPDIASFSPASGPVGTEVTISGSDFSGATQVTFNGTTADNFTVSSSSQIRAVVPSGATDGPISVTTPGGTAASAADFDVTPPPAATDFVPIADTYVKSSDVTGNFGSATTMRVKASGPTQVAYLKFVVSGLSGSAQNAKLQLFVTQSSSDGGGTYLVSNNYEGAATAWTETGLNFGNAPSVSGAPLSTLGSVTSGQWVEFNVTSAITGDGTYSFALKNSTSSVVFYSTKEGSNPPQLVITGGGTPPPAPDIASFSPASGPVGTEVTITGSNLSGATAVQFNGVSASGYVVDSSSQIRAVVPSGATDGPISVTTPGGTAASAADFDVTPPPAPDIASFSPASGPVGTEVTISGNNFSGATQVTFNGTTADNFTVSSSSQIRAVVPSGATDGPISVTTPGGTAASAADFDVTPPPAPDIASFSPASGPVGTEVTISGSDFSGATQVTFNGTTADNFTVSSSSQIRAAVPSGATDGPISVTTPGGIATSAADFDVTAPPPATVFHPTDDAYVRLSNPTSNTGTSSSLRVRKTGSETIYSFLKFNLSGTGGAVQSARLRLYVTSASSDGGAIYSVSNHFEGTSTPWTETALNWNNAPQIAGDALSSVGAVSVDTWVEFDVSAAVTSDGIYSFGIKNNSSEVVFYYSKEATNKPELVITTASPLSLLSQKENAAQRSSQESEMVITAESLPAVVTLNHSHPNPFNLETAILYSLPSEAFVKLRIFNVRGQLVRTLVDGHETAGFRQVLWNGRDDSGSDVSSGLYFVRLEAGRQILVQRVTLQK